MLLGEQQALGRPILVVDPFAGVGRIHKVATSSIITVGIELEAEWAACHPATRCGDSLNGDPALYSVGRRRPDVIATSPCYGNRFSDHHRAKDGSPRRSYTHDLGRDLTPGNSGAMPWGVEYRRFNADAYAVFYKRLRRGGLFLLNVSGFVKAKREVDAPLFHLGAALAAGFVEERTVRLGTQRMTYGANRDRVDTEVVFHLRKPA